MWITDCKYFHKFSKCAISGIYHPVDRGRFPKSYRIVYFRSCSEKNRIKDMANCTYMYCVLVSLGDAIFLWLYTFPEWSLWRPIYVSKHVFMCLQLLSSTCQAQLGPNSTRLSSISDPLRFALCGTWPLVKMLIWQEEPSPIPRAKLPCTSVGGRAKHYIFTSDCWSWRYT